MAKLNTTDDPVMRVDDAAAYIGVSRSTFYTLVNTGALPRGLKFGRSPLWRRSCLNAFLDKAQAEFEEKMRTLKK